MKDSIDGHRLKVFVLANHCCERAQREGNWKTENSTRAIYVRTMALRTSFAIRSGFFVSMIKPISPFFCYKAKKWRYKIQKKWIKEVEGMSGS